MMPKVGVKEAVGEITEEEDDFHNEEEPFDSAFYKNENQEGNGFVLFFRGILETTKKDISDDKPNRTNPL